MFEHNQNPFDNNHELFTYVGKYADVENAPVKIGQTTNFTSTFERLNSGGLSFKVYECWKGDLENEVVNFTMAIAITEIILQLGVPWSLAKQLKEMEQTDSFIHDIAKIAANELKTKRTTITVAMYVNSIKKVLDLIYNDLGYHPTIRLHLTASIEAEGKFFAKSFW